VQVAVHHAVGISCQRNSGYSPSRVNIMAQGLSTPDPSLSPTHLSIRRGRATTTHCTHHQVSLMLSRNTTLVSSIGLRIGPGCEAGLSVGMRRKRVPPQRTKIKIKPYIKKVRERIVLREIHIRTTGRHLSNGITQCYLLPDRGGRPAFTPTGQVGTRFIDPVRMKGWVSLVGWLHTEMVYPSTDGHPSEY